MAFLGPSLNLQSQSFPHALSDLSEGYPLYSSGLKTSLNVIHSILTASRTGPKQYSIQISAHAQQVLHRVWEGVILGADITCKHLSSEIR